MPSSAASRAHVVGVDVGEAPAHRRVEHHAQHLGAREAAEGERQQQPRRLGDAALAGERQVGEVAGDAVVLGEHRLHLRQVAVARRRR